MKLLGLLLEFDNAPRLQYGEQRVFEAYIGRPISWDSYCDPLTREPMSYRDFLQDYVHRRHGKSRFQLGHMDPTRRPKHVPENVCWQYDNSNFFQGEQTLVQARALMVRAVKRLMEERYGS